MATAYPGALDTTGSQLRTDIASTDDLDATGKEHHTMHVNVNGATVALETKLGIGASAASGASDGDALTKQADGSTAWEALPSSGISWSGSTANGLATYGSSSSVVSESTATYDATTLELTTSGGGLKLDGLNSSNANTLDDYEEGEWTATLVPGTSGTIGFYSNWDGGAYIKVGKLVVCTGRFYVEAISSPVGILRMGGFPFTVGNVTDYGEYSTAFIGIRAPSATINPTVLMMTQGAAVGDITGQWGWITDYYAQISPLIDAGTAEIGVCISYMANA